jgi:hypothetical protein
MYGGLKHETSPETGLTVHEVCNEVWAFDTSAKTWENITVKFEPPCQHSSPHNTSMCGEYTQYIFFFLFKFLSFLN